MIRGISLQARLAALLLLLLAMIWAGAWLQARASADASARSEVETRLRTTASFVLSVSERSDFDSDFIDTLMLQRLRSQGRAPPEIPDFEVRQAGAVVTRSAHFPETVSLAPGLREVVSQGSVWLVYTSTNKQPGNMGRAALPEAVASARAEDLRAELTLPFVLGLPLAALAVLAALWVGLRPLREIERQIGAVDPGAPRPLDIDARKLPRELRSLTGQFNWLMEVLNSVLVRQKAFATAASHEMRTPLAGARSQLDVLERSADPDLTADARGKLAATLRRLDRLVSQMLLLARGEAALDGEERKVVDLRVQLRELQGEMTEQYPRSRWKLYGFEEKVEVLGYETLLRALFRNLLENALKHSGKGNVGIALASTGTEVEIAISDDGPGFPAGDNDHLFEPFRRPEEAKGTGAGLGLAVAKSVADLHRGKIVLSSGAEGGTAIVTIPRSQTD